MRLQVLIIGFGLSFDKMDVLSHNDISMETLQTSIVNAIKAIGSSKKRADELTVYKLVKKGTPFSYKYRYKRHPRNIK